MFLGVLFFPRPLHIPRTQGDVRQQSRGEQLSTRVAKGSVQGRSFLDISPPHFLFFYFFISRMTTEENENDLKKGGGYLKEKFLIGLSRITNDEVERAIMKVTSHMLKAPNEKHMARLLQATYGQYNSGSVEHGDVNRYIIDELEKRSHAHSWIVVLKTYVALHRFMSEASADMIRVMQGRMGLFSIRNIKDLADSPDGAAQKTFIQQYIRYLEERNIVSFKLLDHGIRLKMETDEFLSSITSLEVQGIAGTLLPVFELLLGQLEALSKIEFRAIIVNNFLTLEAYVRAIRDGKRLYQVLVNRVLAMLEVFEDLDLTLKMRWLKAYQQFDKTVKGLAATFAAMNAANIHWGETIPTIKLLSDTLMKRLEDEVKFSSVQPEELTTALAAQLKTEDNGPRVPASESTRVEQRGDGGVTESTTNSTSSPSANAATSGQAAMQTATAPTTAAEAIPAASTVKPGQQPASATAPRHEALDDLFGSPIVISRAPRVGEPAETKAAQSREDLFAGAPPPAVAALASAPAATTSARTGAANPDSLFDAWDPKKPGQQQQSSVAPPGGSAATIPATAAPRLGAATAAGFDPFASEPTVPASSTTSTQQQQAAAGGSNVDFFFTNTTAQQQAASRSTATTQRANSPQTAFSQLAAESRGRAW